MKIATISEAKNKLSQLLDWVKSGETVVIVDRDVPVARLEAMVKAGEPNPDGRLERLERKGWVRRGRGAWPKGFFDRPLPKGRRADIVKTILEEREDSR